MRTTAQRLAIVIAVCACLCIVALAADSNKAADADMQVDLESNNYYTRLGVYPWASAKSIKLRYLKLAKKWHPDRNSDDPKASDKYMNLHTAYNTLKDPEKRDLYDAVMILTLGQGSMDEADRLYTELSKDLLNWLKSDQIKPYWDMVPKMPKWLKQNKLRLTLAVVAVNGLATFWLVGSSKIMGGIVGAVWWCITGVFDLVRFFMLAFTVDGMLHPNEKPEEAPVDGDWQSFGISVAISLVLWYVVLPQLWKLICCGGSGPADDETDGPKALKNKREGNARKARGGK